MIKVPNIRDDLSGATEASGCVLHEASYGNKILLICIDAKKIW